MEINDTYEKVLGTVYYVVQDWFIYFRRRLCHAADDTERSY